MTPRDQQGGRHATPAVSLEKALEIVDGTVQPVTDIEAAALRAALDRVLGEDVRALANVPAQTNSAMDGYAFQGADLAPSAATRLALIGTAAAGHPFAGEVGSGQCVRILTGAPIPAGADTVVLQENVTRDGQVVQIDEPPVPGENVRAAGEDIAAGTLALAAGTVLGPAELGVLASLGLPEARVRRRPRVSFFSTGDELREVGSTLADGQIYDSNRYTLHGLLSRLDVEHVDLGVVPDDPGALAEALRGAAADADLVVTTGGVSVGDADHVKATLAELGEVLFRAVHMKPGRPAAFGRIGDTPYFGLPGNPVSVMATFHQLVRPAVLRLRGEPAQPPLTVTARCASEIRTRAGRCEFQRGVLRESSDGGREVAVTGPQGSGILSSMTEANCFIVIPAAREHVAAGSEVLVQPFVAFT